MHDTPLASPYRQGARWLCSAFLALMPLAHAVASSPDGQTWHAHDAGIKAAFNTVSVQGERVIAASSGGAILQYEGGQWKPLEGWSSFLEGKPFGDANDARQIRAALTRQGTIWIGSYAPQGVDVSFSEGSFTLQPRGTGARVTSMAVFDSTVISGLNNGRVMISTILASGSPFRLVRPLPGGGQGSVIAVGGSSTSNIWASTGTKLFRATNAGSQSIKWTEETLPDYVQGSVRAIGVSQDEGTYLGASASGTTTLFRWQNGAFDSEPLYTFTGSEFFNITGIYVQDMNNVWIIGDAGNLWYFNGSTMAQIDIGSSAPFTAISGSDNGIWVVGGGGQVFSTVAP